VTGTLTVAQSVTSMSLTTNTTQVSASTKPHLTANGRDQRAGCADGTVSFFDNYVDNTNTPQTVT